MKSGGPHLTLEIHSAMVPESGKATGEEIQALFTRAETLVEQAMRESLVWERVDGVRRVLAPAALIRLDYEPAPSSVRIHLSVPSRALCDEIDPVARLVLARLKRRWWVRLKIALGFVMGADLKRADQENLDRIATDLRTLVSGWVLHTVGFRLSLLLREAPQDLMGPRKAGEELAGTGGVG